MGITQPLIEKYTKLSASNMNVQTKGEVTPIFFGVGTAISHEPDEPESVPAVPVVPAPALESAPLAPSVIFWISYKKKSWSKCNLMGEIITLTNN